MFAAMPILPTRTWACIFFDTQVTSLLLVALIELAPNSEYAILRDVFAEVIICPKGTYEKVPAKPIPLWAEAADPGTIFSMITLILIMLIAFNEMSSHVHPRSSA